jgi:hypothetical protein
MHARPFLWIVLVMAGVTVEPRGHHPWAHTCLFVSPPPLVEVGLGHECVAQPQFSASDFASVGAQELI